MTKLVAVAICSSFLVAAAISIGATSKYWMKEGKKMEEEKVQQAETRECVKLTEDSFIHTGSPSEETGSCKKNKK